MLQEDLSIDKQKRQQNLFSGNIFQVFAKRIYILLDTTQIMGG
jgi:hypothetical protein